VKKKDEEKGENNLKVNNKLQNKNRKKQSGLEDVHVSSMRN
jgi:hypothetical protein